MRESSNEHTTLPTGRGFGLLMKESLAMVDIATATVYFASKKCLLTTLKKSEELTQRRAKHGIP
jgi:hypothetical protein